MEAEWLGIPEDIEISTVSKERKKKAIINIVSAVSEYVILSVEVRQNDQIVCGLVSTEYF